MTREVWTSMEEQQDDPPYRWCKVDIWRVIGEGIVGPHAAAQDELLYWQLEAMRRLAEPEMVWRYPQNEAERAIQTSRLWDTAFGKG